MQLEDTPALRAIAIRFWPKVNKDGPVQSHCPDLGPCWVWTASLGSNGYGQIGDERHKPIGAHRVSWRLVFGAIPVGLSVLHKCDNRVCVRPAHLFLGTHGDNARDAAAKGRMHTGPLPKENFPRGDQHWMKRTPELVLRGAVHPSHLHPEKMRRGESHGIAKLTDDQVREIRRIYATGALSQHKLAVMFQVSAMTVNHIVNGRIWRHLL